MGEIKKTKVLFSVQQISGYLLAGLRELQKVADIVILYIPFDGFIAEDDPLKSQLKWIDQTVHPTLQSVLAELDGWTPDIYLCGGWVYKPYLALARYFKRKTTTITVLRIDTAWQGSLRQFVHCIISRFRMAPFFHYGWGAGTMQEEYLHRLGIKKTKSGVYAADVEKFKLIAQQRSQPWPHKFLYIGRYVAVKNMHRMEKAFLKALELDPTLDWELVCIGGGELWEQRTVHPRIRHLGYKKPWEIQDYIEQSGCFILPSTYEPWGVVVQEAAVMGLPMICSKLVNSTSRYLKEDVNGYLFDPYDVSNITEKMLQIMRKSDKELEQMGRESYEIGNSYTPQDWANKLLSFLD
jgi:glycosyltransferase involved in cell wall biosynthesis